MIMMRIVSLVTFLATVCVFGLPLLTLDRGMKHVARQLSIDILE
jgi:hypothetical protein